MTEVNGAYIVEVIVFVANITEINVANMAEVI